jgi:hypothetical protein
VTVTAGADQHSLLVAWQPPADAVGGTIGGYAVEVLDAATGEPAALAGTEADATGVTVDELATGAYVVRVRAFNEAGLGAAAERRVDLGPVFAFAGFFAPVESPPVVNIAKAGSAIPVNFSLGGDQGLGVFAVGSPRSERVTCDSRDTLSDIAATTTPGASALSYDRLTQRYTYVWKTSSAYAITCRRLTVTFTDGQSHSTEFRFK